MPRVSAGSVGPGWGCTCMSNLKGNQLAKAMGRASLVQFEYRKTEPNGTLVFKAWTRPEDVYDVTFNPQKPGSKLCKHVIACSAHVVGLWLTTALQEIKKEQEECKETQKRLKLTERTAIRLMKKLTPPSST